MTYSESLAERVRRALAGERAVKEKKMFGGIGFLLNGNMCVGVWKTSLVARIGPDAYEHALQQPLVGAFDVTGRAMKGWVLVAAEGVEDDQQLQTWIQRAVEFVRRLPTK